MLLLGFSLAMLLFFVIGAVSVTRARNEVSDYLVAGRSISPLAAGLSAVASNNSGFMFIGAIGFTYRYGLAAVWLFLAWIAGDYLSWMLVHRRLRRFSEQRKANSIPSFLAHDGERLNRSLQIVLGSLTLVFLSLYAAAQLQAGGKALQTVLDWDPGVGVVIGAVLVLAYSFAGGIRASIWTDVAQSLVMILAMTGLLIVAHLTIVRLPDLPGALQAIDPALLMWTPPDASLGLIPYALGWFIAGFGGIGQPHIIIRAMTIDNEVSIPTMRRTYFSWYVAFSLLTFAVGLYARVHFAGAGTAGDFDPETALPMLAVARLPELIVGFVIAALFAATMSTADSQVLACSASLTQDITTRFKDSYLAGKLATVIVVVFALAMALVGPDSVFVLVTVAWGLLTTCFAPLMVARVRGWRVTTRAYLTSTVAGLAAMLVWSYVLGMGDAVYDGAIGFVVTMAGVAWAARRARVSRGDTGS